MSEKKYRIGRNRIYHGAGGVVVPRKRNTMKRKYEENKIQINIVEQHNIYFPHILLTHPANQGRSPQEGAKLKRMGVLAGVSDILLWWNKGCGAVEIKKAKGKEQLNQMSFGDKMKRFGHNYAVCKSWEEYYKALVQWGIEPLYPCRVFKEANLTTWDDKVKASLDMYKPR